MDEDRKQRMIEKGCPACEGVLEYIGYNKFKCVKCNTTYKAKTQKSIPNINDTSTWKSTCDECGGIMDYYNFKYGCRKCGNILEV